MKCAEGTTRSCRYCERRWLRLDIHIHRRASPRDLRRSSTQRWTPLRWPCWWSCGLGRRRMLSVACAPRVAVTDLRSCPWHNRSRSRRNTTSRLGIAQCPCETVHYHSMEWRCSPWAPPAAASCQILHKRKPPPHRGSDVPLRRAHRSQAGLACKYRCCFATVSSSNSSARLRSSPLASVSQLAYRAG